MSWIYPHTPENNTLYAVIFWATLPARAIIAVPIGVIIAVVLSPWQQRVDLSIRKKEAQREVYFAKQAG